MKFCWLFTNFELEHYMLYIFVRRKSMYLWTCSSFKTTNHKKFTNLQNRDLQNLFVDCPTLHIIRHENTLLPPPAYLIMFKRRRGLGTNPSANYHRKEGSSPNTWWRTGERADVCLPVVYPPALDIRSKRGMLPLSVGGWGDPVFSLWL